MGLAHRLAKRIDSAAFGQVKQSTVNYAILAD
jgi:hypothetical protein